MDEPPSPGGAVQRRRVPKQNNGKKYQIGEERNTIKSTMSIITLRKYGSTSYEFSESIILSGVVPSLELDLGGGLGASEASAPLSSACRRSDTSWRPFRVSSSTLDEAGAGGGNLEQGKKYQ